MYTDEQVKIIEEDRDQAKQLNVYLLSGLLKLYKLDTSKKVKKIVEETIEKSKKVYPEIYRMKL